MRPYRHVEHYCHACYKETKEGCPNCFSPVAMDRSEYQATYYCSEKCRAKHHEDHKEVCKMNNYLIDYEGFSRAIIVLTFLFDMFREEVFEIEIKSIHNVDGGVHIVGGVADDDEIFRKLPANVDQLFGPRTEKLLLHMMASSAPMEKLSKLCSKFLKEPSFSASVVERCYYPNPGPRSWICENADKKIQKAGDAPHAMFLVTLREGRKFGVDLTAAQFGYEDALVQHLELNNTRIKKFIQDFPFGTAAEASEELVRGRHFNQVEKLLVRIQKELGIVLENAVLGCLVDEGVTLNRFLMRLPFSDFSKLLRKMLGRCREEITAHKREYGTEYRDRLRRAKQGN